MDSGWAGLALDLAYEWMESYCYSWSQLERVRVLVYWIACFANRLRGSRFELRGYSEADAALVKKTHVRQVYMKIQIAERLKNPSGPFKPRDGGKYWLDINPYIQKDVHRLKNDNCHPGRANRFRSKVSFASCCCRCSLDKPSLSSTIRTRFRSTPMRRPPSSNYLQEAQESASSVDDPKIGRETYRYYSARSKPTY